MKLTIENEKILLSLGFKPENETKTWWTLKDGWAFRMNSIKGFEHLIERLMKTEYERGIENTCLKYKVGFWK